ncbi:transcriptional regulator LysR family [Photobacterium aphoticum]|uniref:Transcriptional regulator LysR family n=1 Tax=Photobacterium aphoticum TaxID=754436 RepID=A0A090R902_9GAMM|nr:transcriptional regulator LysR family [Photobacterium aphoticum]
MLITHQQFVKDDIKHGMLVQLGEAVLNPHQAFYWICAKEKLKDEGVLTLRHWLREQFQAQ